MREPSGEYAGAACWCVLEISCDGPPATWVASRKVEFPDIGGQRGLHKRELLTTDCREQRWTRHIRNNRYRLFIVGNRNSSQLLTAQHDVVVVAGPCQSVDKIRNEAGSQQARCAAVRRNNVDFLTVADVALERHSLAIMRDCRVSIAFRIRRRITNLPRGHRTHVECEQPHRLLARPQRRDTPESCRLATRRNAPASLVCHPVTSRPTNRTGPPSTGAA